MNSSISFGDVCQYGKLHNWYLAEWQIIPDGRSFDVCSYSLEITYNVIPIIFTILILVVGVVGYKKYKSRNRKR